MKNEKFAWSLMILFVISSVVSWTITDLSIDSSILYFPWTLSIISFSLWGLLFAIICQFYANRTLIYSAFAFSLLGYLVFMGNLYTFLASVGVFLAMVYCERVAKQMLIGVKRLSFFRSTRFTLQIFVTLVSFLIAYYYYFVVVENKQKLIPKLNSSFYEHLVDYSLKIAPSVLPEKKDLIEKIKSGMTVDQYLLENSPEIQITEDYKLNSLIESALKNDIQQAMIEAEKNQIEKEVGIEIKGNETLRNFLIRYTNFRGNLIMGQTYSEKILFYLPILVSIGIFFTLKLVGWIACTVVEIIATGLIYLFYKSNLLRFQKEVVEINKIDPVL